MSPRGQLPLARAVPVAILAVTLVAPARPARAQSSLDGFVELTATRTEETTANAGFEPTRTDVDSLNRRANFTLTQRLFPNLQLLIGGFFEKQDVRGEVFGLEVDNERVTYRPFVRMRLDTRTVRGDLGFDRTDQRNDASGARTRSLRDTWAANAGWFPDASNYLQFRYVHNQDTLSGSEEIERTSAAFSVDSISRPTRWLTLQYRSSYDVQNDRTLRSRTESSSNNARVSAAQTFWRSRLSLAGDYNWTEVKTRQRSRTGGDVDVRLFPAAGLAAVDDTPDRDPLAANAALIDGDRALGAAINLGFQPGDSRRRNFGIDLGIPIRTNVLRVWVDRRVRAEVAATFSWEIWTSDDNDLWTFRRALASAPFDPFEDRFDLVFEAISARYVKIVVRPLEATDPFASEFPVIEVTDLEAFERVPPSQVAGSLSRSSDRVTFNSRLKLLERHPLFYDLSYLRNSAEGSGSSTALINGLSYARAFSTVWSLAARLADEQTRSTGRERQSANFLSATVSANPLPTFSSSLFLGGRRETIQGIDRKSANAVLSATAAIYRGIDLSVSLGGSRIRQENGRTTDATLVNVSAAVSPHPAFALVATLQDNSRTDRGGGQPEVEDPNKAAELTLTLNPLPTLYLYASHRVEKRSEFLIGGDPKRTLDNYAASWAPFPYGALRLSFNWNETYDTQFDALTRTWGPTLRWNIRPRWFLDVSYRKTDNDSDQQIIDRDEMFVTLRLGF